MKIWTLLVTIPFCLGGGVSTADLESMKQRLPQIVELKDRAIVGEQPDGLLGMVKDDISAKSVVEAENQDRKEEYHKRAMAQGQPLETLASVLGEARIEKEKPGRFIRTKEGKWVKK